MKNMPILKLKSGMRMRRLDGPSKRHIIRNSANKEINRIAKKNSTGRIIRGAAAAVRAVVPEDKVVVDIKKLLISVSSLALSRPSSLRRNPKNSLMRTHQQSNLPPAMVATPKPAIDK